jgi:hypothetical protein
VQIKITPRPASKELADQRTIDKELASRDEQLEQKHFATPEEIEKEKLPTEEILSLPMFKVDFYLYYYVVCTNIVWTFGQPECRQVLVILSCNVKIVIIICCSLHVVLLS